MEVNRDGARRGLSGSPDKAPRQFWRRAPGGSNLQHVGETAPSKRHTLQAVVKVTAKR